MPTRPVMAESAFGPISPELVLVSPDLRAALMREFQGTDRDRGRRFDVPPAFARPPAAEQRPPERTGSFDRHQSPEPERLVDRHRPAEPERPLEQLSPAQPAGLPEPNSPQALQPGPARTREPAPAATQASELLPARESQAPLELDTQPSLVVGTAAYFIQRVLVLAGQAAVVVAAVVVAIVALELLSHL